MNGTLCPQCGLPMVPVPKREDTPLRRCPNGHLYFPVNDRPWHYEGTQTEEGVYPLDRVDEEEK
jgi:hypothetical protein